MRKLKQADDESLEFILGVGAVSTFTPLPDVERPKKSEKAQIGFVRQEHKRKRKRREINEEICGDNSEVEFVD